MLDFDIEYDSVLSCYCLHFAGEVVCLAAQTHSEAVDEAVYVVEQWVE